MTKAELKRRVRELEVRLESSELSNEALREELTQTHAALVFWQNR